MMESLTTCSVNQLYQFQEFEGDKSFERHLRNLGLVVGVNLYVVSKEIGQPLIIVFGATRIGLDEEIAKGIFVAKSTETRQEKLQVMTELAIGEVAKVNKILGSGPLKRRLMDMGLTRGTKVEIKKYAPLGDPIEIQVRNYELTLRKKEAELILVESLEVSDDDKTDCFSW